MTWAELARAAAITLSTGEEREDDSVTAQLIRDVSVVFLAKDDEPMKTSDLLDGLYRIEESPWGDWFGKPLSAHGFSRLLKAYRIRTMPVYAEGKTVRGYKLGQFSDAFAQLGVRRVSSVRPEARSHAAPNAPDASNAWTSEPGDNDAPPPVASTVPPAGEREVLADLVREFPGSTWFWKDASGALRVEPVEATWRALE